MNEDIARSLALMQHINQPYFFIEDKSKEEPITWYKGVFDEQVQEFIQDAAKTGNVGIYFSQWLEENDLIIKPWGYDNENYEDYMVLTNVEADEQFTDYIRETIWACNTQFILDTCGLNHSTHLEEAIRSMQEKECEYCNNDLLSLVEETCGLPEFVEAVKDSDSRGALSCYDGEEYEEVVDGVTYYIYRIN